MQEEGHGKSRTMSVSTSGGLPVESVKPGMVVSCRRPACMCKPAC